MTLPDDISLRLDALAAGVPPPLGQLSPPERERLAAYGSGKRQRSFALGRALARGLLAEALDLPPLSVPLSVAEDGALEVGGGLHVSLAHTEVAGATLAAAAVAARPVGVDLEALRPRRPDLYRFLLPPEEYALLDAFPDLDRAHVALWAIKEAVLKARRTGFRCSPKRVRLELDVAAGGGVARVEGGGWEVRFEERGGGVLALAFAL